MDDKYILASIGIVSLVAYGCVALATGHNGTVMVAIVGVVASIVAGTVGYMQGKKV